MLNMTRSADLPEPTTRTRVVVRVRWMKRQARRKPGAAIADFRRVASRQIPDFAAQYLALPDRVVVTGGTGCIGTVLLQLLTEHGVAAVASISRRPPQGIRRVDGVRYLLADIRDLGSGAESSSRSGRTL